MTTLSQVIEERDQALEEVRYLKSVLADFVGNGLECEGEDAKFTKSERLVLSILKGREGKIVRRSAIYSVMYSTRPDADMVVEKSIDVWICKIRRKLKRHSIETYHGIGWRLIPLTSETHNA
jgi:DNA-binding response OmpR family regulator